MGLLCAFRNVLDTLACPPATPGPARVCCLQGLYSCSAGTHPGGSVIGCAGHNAAAALVKDMGLQQWWRLPPSASGGGSGGGGGGGDRGA